jgi:hypothetical protein
VVIHSRHNGRLVDNVCAAVCRMILARMDLVPLKQVLPVLLQNLPLKQDMEENETVYSCIYHLLQSGNIEVTICHLREWAVYVKFNCLSDEN